MRNRSLIQCVTLSSTLFMLHLLVIDNTSPEEFADITLSWIMGVAIDAFLAFLRKHSESNQSSHKVEQRKTRTYQTIKMFMTVHIRHFDCKRRETVIVHRGFTDILCGSSSISCPRRCQRIRTARSIVALVQAVFINPAYCLSGTSRPLDLLS